MKKTVSFLITAAVCIALLGSSPADARSKAKKKKARVVPAPQEEVKKPEPRAPISPDVIDALARGSLSEAAIELREQKSSAKSHYLLREVTRIVMHETSRKRPKRDEAHQYYQNLGISYHNLFLFLKTNGYSQDEFVKEALKFYKKSKAYATPMHKPETDILMAALLISNGYDKKAEEVIGKVDMTKLGVDFQTQEYLASYYAARGDPDLAIESLKAAYQERPDVILTWLAVGDDFALIKDDPRFTALLGDWHFSHSKKRLDLSVPKYSAPKLQFAEPAVQFRHPAAPQAQPHYRLKKDAKKKAALAKATSKKKAAAAKKSSNTKTKKKTKKK